MHWKFLVWGLAGFVGGYFAGYQVGAGECARDTVRLFQILEDRHRRLADCEEEVELRFQECWSELR